MTVPMRQGVMQLDLTGERGQSELARLHDRVVQFNGRVELTALDGSMSVLVSKNELQAIEQALDILSDTKDVRAMRDELMHIAVLAR